MVLDFLKKSSYCSNPYNSKSDNSSKRLKNKFIWIPKNLSLIDKNTYIASYIHDICNSCNYVYTNRKSNSNWVWSPKS